MTLRLRIAVRPDGTIVAETEGIQGPACLDELDRIRRLTGGSVESSRLSNDFAAVDDVEASTRSEGEVRDVAGE